MQSTRLSLFRCETKCEVYKVQSLLRGVVSLLANCYYCRSFVVFCVLLAESNTLIFCFVYMNRMKPIFSGEDCE